MVYYRKYRPQSIEELDSEIVRKNLTAIFSSENVPHAFLLAGPKGLGKTSTARIIAKVVNCERKEKPCNECDECISITNGTNLDILELDGASNRGIDEIRSLRERIKLSPSGKGKKIFIIDEVHMLTNEAFNALLKTLEEPPSHVIFILCTTELHKVPETIRSRCFAIAYKRATVAELVGSLNRIVKGEKLTIEKVALEMIAKASDGSFRDASKLLEQAVQIAGDKKISEDVVSQITKSSSDASGISVFLKKKDTKGALSWINTAVENGVDMKDWLTSYIASLHDALLKQYGIETQVQAEQEAFSADELKALLLLLSRAHGEMKFAVIPQMPIELCIIEYCNSKQ